MTYPTVFHTATSKGSSTAESPTIKRSRRSHPPRADQRTAWPIEGEVPLFPKIKVASSFFKRMRGLLGSPPRPQLLMIAPCHSIHTYGMRYPIHVAFFDKRGIVIHSERAVPPGTKRSCNNACGVLEMPAVFENDHWFSSGDHLRLAPPEVSRP
ncbi:DUF192 domain-containing protein [Anaerotardibacter muris]|uniref:DUF192 domain-containing protein n=1 Tax=Anaerotardibacter muris TaxID=2941505 RepID=UPI00203EF670|nr:DUF192 domain-containing protein [Anaerotardibacter muris]